MSDGKLKNIQELLLSHQGKPILLCGMGPSLRSVNQRQVDSVVSIGCNVTPAIMRTDYVVVADEEIGPGDNGNERVQQANVVLSDAVKSGAKLITTLKSPLIESAYAAFTAIPFWNDFNTYAVVKAGNVGLFCLNNVAQAMVPA
jgi:hypothetical protein